MPVQVPRNKHRIERQLRDIGVVGCKRYRGVFLIKSVVCVPTALAKTSPSRAKCSKIEKFDFGFDVWVKLDCRRCIIVSGEELGNAQNIISFWTYISLRTQHIIYPCDKDFRDPFDFVDQKCKKILRQGQDSNLCLRRELISSQSP